MRLIFTEEGFRGLFSGVIPQLCTELVFVVSSAVFSFLATRAIVPDFGPQMNAVEAMQMGRPPAHVIANDNNKEKAFKWSQKVFAFLTRPVGSFFSSRLSVVSTVMTCVGSSTVVRGLAVSVLPYSPTFNNWREWYWYLRPRGLCLATLFRREHTGAVLRGMGNQLYAWNKYYL
ncbi:hypothetical protein PMAYCL1PPCAC_05401 [Pristionchus mayeri]|uniref:Uncharacterized protein n=1 Tax=Pristionchus mayeri TaxID=1317129 RepID=A0AAN4Z6T5_9BILA|nr:hypothetical protein PMAYCL1PPCAC_05401 [Pristionchus mayeri]